MPLHPLTNFEIKRYYQNEPRFNGVFSKDNLPKKIKHGAYITNLHSMQVLVSTGLLYFVKKAKLFIWIVLVLSMFLKKLKNLSEIKTPKQTFFEYNQTIQ